MTDIITRAKRLLEGAAPGPWKVYAWERHPDSDVHVVADDSNTVTGDGWISPADGDLIAAAPELAKAVAEEYWEYRVLVKGNAPGLEERIFGSLEAAQKEYTHQRNLHRAKMRGQPSPIEVRRVTEWELVE